MFRRIKKLFSDEQQEFNEPLENYFDIMGSDKEDICGTRKAKREI
jgi:hypothetical protein